MTISKPAPLFRFGVIADVQYCDTPDGRSFEGVPRHYRGALNCLQCAVDDWNHRNDLAFIVQLGDLLDGKCAELGQRDTALATLMAEFKRCSVREVYHCIGNHELYNFSRAELVALLGTVPQDEPAKGLRATGREYYSFSPVPGWRFIMLDPYQVAVIGCDASSSGYREAAELLAGHNPNDVFNPGSVWSKGLTSHERRWLPYNGALGAAQLAWLRAELALAKGQGERVVVLSHVLLLPDVSAFDAVWDYEAALAILAEADCVVAVVTGHSHPGGYQQDAAGIHHLVLPSPLNCGSSNECHGHIEVYEDRLELVGRGIVPSYSLPFPAGASALQSSGPILANLASQPEAA